MDVHERVFYSAGLDTCEASLGLASMALDSVGTLAKGSRDLCLLLDCIQQVEQHKWPDCWAEIACENHSVDMMSVLSMVPALVSILNYLKHLMTALAQTVVDYVVEIHIQQVNQAIGTSVR